jgi:hypothetical protein
LPGRLPFRFQILQLQAKNDPLIDARAVRDTERLLARNQFREELYVAIEVSEQTRKRRRFGARRNFRGSPFI